MSVASDSTTTFDKEKFDAEFDEVSTEVEEYEAAEDVIDPCGWTCAWTCSWTS